MKYLLKVGEWPNQHKNKYLHVLIYLQNKYYMQPSEGEEEGERSIRAPGETPGLQALPYQR